MVPKVPKGLKDSVATRFFHTMYDVMIFKIVIVFNYEICIYNRNLSNLWSYSKEESTILRV